MTPLRVVLVAAQVRRVEEGEGVVFFVKSHREFLCESDV